jgi:succinate dehydrogenase/fumarate reductase flavoprotein subunit
MERRLGELAEPYKRGLPGALSRLATVTTAAGAGLAAARGHRDRRAAIAAGLAALVAEPYPLARLIGAACLAREESRGAHQRTDHPDTKRELDCMHTLVGRDAAPRFERWQ